MKKRSVLSLLILVSFALPVSAQNVDLDPEAAAGKLIYDAVTHRVGCVRCHAPDGTAQAEGKTYAAERSIQGKTAQEIRISIMATPMMWNVKLNDEELEQVAAYLRHLQNSSD